MTPDEIRAMDGAALGRLAWDLGLAPEGVVWPEGCAYAYDEDDHAWRPWSRLAQADAVFRQLRARGWDTHQGYDVATQGGHCTAFAPRRSLCWEGAWRGAASAEEATALVRCACLAVASEQEAP